MSNWLSHADCRDLLIDEWYSLERRRKKMEDYRDWQPVQVMFTESPTRNGLARELNVEVSQQTRLVRVADISWFPRDLRRFESWLTEYDGVRAWSDCLIMWGIGQAYDIGRQVFTWLQTSKWSTLLVGGLLEFGEFNQRCPNEQFLYISY